MASKRGQAIVTENMVTEGQAEALRLRRLADASLHDLHSSMDCLNTFIYLQVRGSTCHGLNIRSEDSFWELHSSGLTANVFTDWAISPTQNHGCS